MNADVPFKLSGGRYVFVTARYTNSGLVITSPIYLNAIDMAELIIYDENGTPLTLKEEHIKSDWEQVIVRIYNINGRPKTLRCEYKDYKTTISPTSFDQPKCKLAEP